MSINWKISEEDDALIQRIVTRTCKDLPNAYEEQLECSMDLTACHLNGCPLDLPKLLEAPPFDFGHDIYGIRKHIDRETGKLGNCFIPRYRKRES